MCVYTWLIDIGAINVWYTCTDAMWRVLHLVHWPGCHELPFTLDTMTLLLRVVIYTWYTDTSSTQSGSVIYTWYTCTVVTWCVLLQVLDQDGDGKISVGDFRYFMTTLGEKMTDEEVEDMLKSVYKRKNNNFDSIEYSGKMFVEFSLIRHSINWSRCLAFCLSVILLSYFLSVCLSVSFSVCLKVFLSHSLICKETYNFIC